MLQNVKKVEIIVSYLEVPAVLKILKKNAIEGYTVINNVSGSGEHGYSGDDLITNSYIMIICTQLEMAEQLSIAMQPLLKKLGGVFIVTDAQWIAH
ncbi:P-II family nitrogen regulator [Chamaesiphon sp.]|uniref:P-II family nitrogen regulator n=1 Tax=Chamaesiphon sp. TaxID=2814140 RepID=UPI0035930A0B